MGESDEQVERMRGAIVIADTWKRSYDQAAERIAALVAERDGLREALKPFAVFGEIIVADPAMALHADDTPAAVILFADGVRRTLTFGDLRRAALAQGGETKTPAETPTSQP
jgi:phosphohistidine swiveling domain-containing protein